MNRDIERSCAVAMRTFYIVKKQLQVGMTEQEIVTLVKAVLTEEGSEKPAFQPIAALGSNAASPHHNATRRRARVGDMLVLDFGAVVNGMRSDMTRTLFFGSVKPVYRRWYAVCFEAQKRAYRAARAGRTGTEVDAIARNYVEHVLGVERFVHGLGHGIGRAIHQSPWLTPKKKGSSVLRSGDYVTLEPGVYFKGKGGIRIEDVCEILPDKARWVVRSQRSINRMIVK